MAGVANHENGDNEAFALNALSPVMEYQNSQLSPGFANPNL